MRVLPSSMTESFPRSVHAGAPTFDNSSYDHEPLPGFLLFPIEGLLELDAKEGWKFFRGSLEAVELVGRHLDRIAAGIGHRALRSAARVATTGMYARQGSDDVHILAYSGLEGSFGEVNRGCQVHVC